MPLSSLTKHKYFYPFSILVIWAIGVCYVNPVGDFPLNDDWSYARPVKSFIEKGHLELTGWPAMTLIGHLVYGILLTKVFGFSFTVLRMGLLVMGLVGIVSTYSLLLSFKVPPFQSFLSALLIGFNPMYVCLSYSYMTDVSFYAFFTLSLLFYLKEVQNPKIIQYIAAFVFSLLATSIRQPGIILPFAFAIVCFIRDKSFKRIAYAAGPFVLVVGALAFYEFYYRYQIGYQDHFSNKNLVFINTLLHEKKEMLWAQLNVNSKIALYIGLFLFPFALPLVKKTEVIKTHKITFWGTTTFFCAALLGFMEWQGKVMPSDGGNILTNLGVGPASLYDHEWLKVRPLAVSDLYWKGVTILSFFSFSILFCFLAEQAWQVRKHLLAVNPIFIYCLICVVVYIPMVSMFSFYDRYTLPILLFVLTMIYSFQKQVFETRLTKVVLVLYLLLASFYSFASTSTYLNWNRAKWKAVDELINKHHVSTRELDGGFEVNGWYNYDAKDPNKRTPEKSWWWVDKDTYIISFAPISGRVIFGKYPYHNDLTGADHALYVCVKP